MKEIRLTLIIAITLLLSQGFIFPETNVDVNGKWEMTIKSPRGEKTRALEFIQNGEILTVKWLGGKGNIKEATGTIEGDKIEWSVTRNLGKEKTRRIYKGIVKGDTITGQFIAGKRKPRTWQARRVSIK